MPYLPPEGDVYTEEHDCVLVFFPKMPEYRRALLGAITDLSNAWNWEADRETQAQIRSAWLLAEEKTLECWNMTCLDDLLSAIQSLEQTVKDYACCDPNAPQTTSDGVNVYPHEQPGVEVPSDETDFSTDPYPITPATDPDGTGVVTRADWEKYACGAANLLIDTLVDWLRFTDFALSLGYGVFLVMDELVKLIAARILPGWLDDIAVWTLPSYTEIILEHYDNVTSQLLQEAIGDIEAVRRDLQCAILGQNTAEAFVSAFIAILNGHVQNATILALLTSGPIMAIASLIWNGAFNADWLDCQCDGEAAQPLGMLVTINEGPGNFLHSTNTVRSASTGTEGVFTSTDTMARSGQEMPRTYARGPQEALDAVVADVETDEGVNPEPTDMELRLEARNNAAATSYDVDWIIDVEAIWHDDQWKTVRSLDVVSASDGVTVTGTRITIQDHLTPVDTTRQVTFTPRIF